MVGKDKMIAARTRLLIDAAFFGTIAVGLKMREDNNLKFKSMATDGEWLLYDREWVDSLSKQEIVGVIAHEVLHIVLMHHLRMGNRNPSIWGSATDYAINILLKDEGYTLPECGLLDEKYRDWSAEKIYTYLFNNPDQQPQTVSSIGEVLPAGSLGSEGDQGSGQPLTVEQISAEVGRTKAKIQGAALQAKKAGQLTAGIKRIIEEVCVPKADWKEVLQRFVSAAAFNDWQYDRCHTRMLHSYGIISPVIGGETVGKLAIIVDTSGSVDAKQLAQFAGEISDILENYDCHITVIYIDTVINHIEEFEQTDLPLNLKAVGGGGTLGKPAYDYVEAELADFSAVIHYTDSYLFDWHKITEPEYPVLMACTAKRPDRDVPSWVEVVDIS